MAQRRSLLLVALLVAVLPLQPQAGRAAAMPATRYTAFAAPRDASCGRGSASIEVSGATGFHLQTGAYRASFGDGRLSITRAGHPGGLRLAALPGPRDLDLLAHVTTRHIVRHAEVIAVTLDAAAAWATASITLQAYTHCPGLLRWTVTLALRGSGATAVPAGTDLVYTDATGVHAAAPAVSVYVGAAPSATAQTYLYDPDMDSTLFYLADLTALNGFFKQTNTTPTTGPFRDPRGGPGSLVGAGANGMGFTLPPGSLDGITPGGPRVTLVDSYLELGAGKPAGEIARASRFLDALGTIYGLLQRPVLQPADWRALGAHTLHDLSGPDVTVGFAGHTYLRAYVSDTRNSPELITQLNVLAGAAAYARSFGNGGDTGRLRAMLDAGLPAFYDRAYGSVVNNLPLPQGADGTTESWYYIGDLVNLARIARAGDATAKRLLLASAGGAIALAHHVHYGFPRVISYTGWQGGAGLQADVTGGYAYLMLQLYDLTGRKEYMDEARTGVEHLAGYGFKLAYETHLTALAATAAARLYVLTGERRYLDMSLLPLANLFAATWLWDCTYGSCTGAYHTFFGLDPLPWSGYIAMMEQEEAWQALREYAVLVGDRAPLSVRTLVAEFCRYSLATLAYTLPPLLPKGVASAAPAEYPFVPRNRLDLFIPLEDLREGSQPSGQIGQEIYGAGGPLALAGLATARLAPDLWLTSPYPFTASSSAQGVRVVLGGTAAYAVTLRLAGKGARRITGVVGSAGAAIVLHSTGQGLLFDAAGGQAYMLRMR